MEVRGLGASQRRWKTNRTDAIRQLAEATLVNR